MVCSEFVCLFDTDLLKFFFNLDIYWLCWVFIAKEAFSSCGERELLSSCGAEASHCWGFFCCEAWAVEGGASVAVFLRPQVTCSVVVGNTDSLAPRHVILQDQG